LHKTIGKLKISKSVKFFTNPFVPQGYTDGMTLQQGLADNCPVTLRMSYKIKSKTPLVSCNGIDLLGRIID
jgi:hypothetical protein